LISIAARLIELRAVVRASIRVRAAFRAT